LTGVRDEAGITALARRNVRAGARVLKIFATGGISSSGAAGEAPFTAREIACAAAVAHESGIRLAAHAHGGPGALAAIEGGVDTIEHAAAIYDRCLEGIVRRNLMVVGTFSILYHPEGIERGDRANPEVLAKVRDARVTMERSWRSIVAAGARIAVGTDSMHGRLAFDIGKLVEWGATAREALSAATVGGAEACGLADRGRLAAGLRADVVAVRGDPFTDIATLASPMLVVRNGRPHLRRGEG
jgi:imidazolonepropionase-like amidohydrolase